MAAARCDSQEPIDAASQRTWPSGGGAGRPGARARGLGQHEVRSVWRKTCQIVREQSRRISRCRLTFFRRTTNAELVTNGAFVRDAILPLDPSESAQIPLWQERVRLDEGFYQSLIEHPLPLRETAIKQISSRSMAIDLYVWLAYRLHVLNDPVEIGWPALRRQFGEGYKELRFFRRDVLPSLKLALAVYPEPHLEVDERAGLPLSPPPPPVPARKGIA